MYDSPLILGTAYCPSLNPFGVTSIQSLLLPLALLILTSKYMYPVIRSHVVIIAPIILFAYSFITITSPFTNRFMDLIDPIGHFIAITFGLAYGWVLLKNPLRLDLVIGTIAIYSFGSWIICIFTVLVYAFLIEYDYRRYNNTAVVIFVFTSLSSYVIACGFRIRWAIRQYQRKRRTANGQCPSCAYDLRGNPEALSCPECGAQRTDEVNKVKVANGPRILRMLNHEIL